MSFKHIKIKKNNPKQCKTNNPFFSLDKRQKHPWTYSTDPYLAAYLFAAAASYSQMQQSDFWQQQQQAKSNLMSPELMQQSNNQPNRPANLPTAISSLLPSSMPPLFVAPPLMPNALLGAPSTAALPVAGGGGEANNPTTTLNSIPSAYLSPGLSYDLMLRTLSLNAASSIQQQQQQNSAGQSAASTLSHGFLNHLRELSADAQSNQSNESNNFKLTADLAVKASSLDFRSSSSASNSSNCSTPSPQPINSNYLANSSSSSLSSHTSINNNSINNSSISNSINNSINNSISNSISNSINNSINSSISNFTSTCKSANRSLKNLKQINTNHDQNSSPANASPLFHSNGSTALGHTSLNKPVKNESSSPAIDLKNDLSAIERFNTVLGHNSSDLIICGSSNKPLFQPYRA